MSDMEKRYHENGKIWLECPLKDGIRNGVCKEYYPSGALRSTCTYQDGLLEGERIYLYENGQKICRQVFREGRVIDSYVPIFGRDGVLKISEYWEHGRCRGYNQNNKLCREYGLFNSSFDGVFREFYESGRISSERFYNAGKMDGFAKEWSPDGSECFVTLYVDGEECGRKKMEYFESGMLLREIDMNGNVPDGLEVTYHENGKVCTRMLYERGMAKDGPVNYYDEDGKPVLFIHWENNTSRTYSEDGQLMATTTYYRDMPNGLSVTYGEDGEKEVYHFDNMECKSKEEFLERTFIHLSEKLEQSLSRRYGYEANTFKEFYEEEYRRIMQQDNASDVFYNYSELLTCPEDMGYVEWIVRQAVREFMLRLRLPNDGPTEKCVVAHMLKMLGEDSKKDN